MVKYVHETFNVYVLHFKLVKKKKKHPEYTLTLFRRSIGLHPIFWWYVSCKYNHVNKISTFLL